MSVAWTIFAFLMGAGAVIGVILLVNELTRRKKADEVTTPTPTPAPTPTPDSAVAPSAPTALTVTVLDADSVLLAWSAPNTDGGSVVTTYVVYVDNVQLIEVDAVVRTLTLHSIAPGTYAYSLRARNSVGEGESTDEQSVTLPAPVPTPTPTPPVVELPTEPVLTGLSNSALDELTQHFTVTATFTGGAGSTSYELAFTDALDSANDGTVTGLVELPLNGALVFELAAEYVDRQLGYALTATNSEGSVMSTPPRPYTVVAPAAPTPTPTPL
jgi:hypothetical protein